MASAPDHDLGWTRTLWIFGRSTTFGLQISLYVSLPTLATTAMTPMVILRMTTAFVDFNGVVPEKVCNC
jgi:hypothetical protein